MIHDLESAGSLSSIFGAIVQSVALPARAFLLLHFLGAFPPLVALVWQDRFARFTGRSPSLPERALLGIATWLAYTLDGLWDVRHAKAGLEGLPARHRFLLRHQRALIWAGALVLGAGLALSTQLSPPHLLAAGIASGSVLAYLLLAQAAPRVMRGWFPRELSVGLFFAVAVGLFTLEDPARDLPPLLAFALLCTANGLAISLDEQAQDHLRGDVTFATTHSRMGKVLGKVLHPALLLFGLGLLLLPLTNKPLWATGHLGAGLGLASVLLALVPLLVREEPLRPAAYDLALCAPLLLWASA